MGDVAALARKGGGSSNYEDKKMTDIPNDIVAPGESVRVTLDGVNEQGERISRVIAEWHGFPNEEANLFSMAVSGAVFSVVDSFSKAKAEQGGGPITNKPRPGDQPPGQMR